MLKQCDNCADSPTHIYAQLVGPHKSYLNNNWKEVTPDELGFFWFVDVYEYDPGTFYRAVLVNITFTTYNLQPGIYV